MNYILAMQELNPIGDLQQDIRNLTTLQGRGLTLNEIGCRRGLGWGRCNRTNSYGKVQIDENILSDIPYLYNGDSMPIAAPFA
jgi:hypothetical protein